MIVDFSKLDFKEQPTLLLKNLDGRVICPLRYAHDISAELLYSEISTLEFRIPRYVDGKEVEGYDKIVGMRLIDWVGVGLFSLVNPKTINKGGLVEEKECKAYSLECELEAKTVFLEEGTYTLYDPVAPDSSALGKVLKDFPSWEVVDCDSELLGKYRSFDNLNDNLYSIMTGTWREAYQCVFEFDTYNRHIIIRSVANDPPVKQVYLSPDNLIKQVEIEEDVESIRTALDVTGAEDVDIRSVNPLGTSRIYNLDAYMNEDFFESEFIDKYNLWKDTVSNNQKPYYDITVNKVLQEAKLEAAKAALVDLNGVKQKYVELQATYVEAAAQGVDMSEELAEVKLNIEYQDGLIKGKQDEIDRIIIAIDDAFEKQKDINEKCAFSNFFKDEKDLKLLDRYIRQDTLEASEFTYSEINSYVTPDTAYSANQFSFIINNATVVGVHRADGAKVYSITNGTLSLTCVVGDTTNIFSGSVISGAVETKTDGNYILTAYLNTGSYNDTSFPRATVTLVGAKGSITSDAQVDGEIGGTYVEGESIAGETSSSDLYFTQNATEYSKRSVEWDLYEYGQEKLEELAWPSYSFEIDSANFLAIDDFILFKNQFNLGERVYLDLNGKIMRPIVVGVSVDFADASKFTLKFGSKYSLNDSAFKLEDLLDESISTGKTVSKSSSSWSSWKKSGAQTQVHDYMTSALDAAKQAVLANSGNIDVSLDGSGLRLREYADDSHTFYKPEQIWMTGKSMVFTRDNWDSALMAIGTFDDPNFGVTTGIVAPQIVGTMLAGESMLIESSKKDGGTAVFRVDADGARLYNSNFDLVNEFEVEGTNNKGWISLETPLGIVSGVDSTAAPLFGVDEDGNRGVYTNGGTLLDRIRGIDYSDDSTVPRASFWTDMYGNAFFKGDVYANSGVFNGTVYANAGTFAGELVAASGTFTGTVQASKFLDALGNDMMDNSKWKSDYLSLSGLEIKDSSGSTVMKFNANGVTMYGGAITWGSDIAAGNISGLASVATSGDFDDLADIPKYIKGTYIDFSQVSSPHISGNDIGLYGGRFTVYNDSGQDKHGFIGHATGAATETITNGIAMSAGNISENISFETDGNYIIATTEGVRMHSSKNGSGVNLYLTPSGAYVDDGDSTIKLGNSVAVFG